MATIINGDGIVTAEGTSTTQGRLRLGEDTDNGTNYVELQAAANIASNLTFTLPSADGTSGQFLQTNGSGVLSFAAAGANIVRSARTSNTILGTADKGNLIAITSGTFTQTFTAAATLESGWFCYIQNSGTGEITLDPNGSETIDGLTSYIMYPNEVRLVQCDGSNFFTIVLDPFYATFTATGTFTKPPGYSFFAGLLWGAGGGGGKTSIDAQIGGGGGGAAVPFTILASAVGTTETITIGAGGTGASANPGNGTAGGNTTFGSLVTSYGGGGGGGNCAANRSGGGGGGMHSAGSTSTDGCGTAGGSPFTGNATNTSPRMLCQNFGGGGTQPGLSGASAYGGGGGGSSSVGGRSLYGGAGGGGVNGNTSATNGGASVFGGAGGNGSRASSGSNGTAPGGGGGATQTGAKAGDGARGEARIWGIT